MTAIASSGTTPPTGVRRREFAAPRHLVYKAWTTPELIKQW